MYFLCLGVSLLCWARVASITEFSVDTKVGTITGLIDTVTMNGTQEKFIQYLGIPYAEAPVGDRRFRKPAGKPPFTEPYNATFFRPACPQGHSAVPMGSLQTSEDCLFLNIFAPIGSINASTQLYPVMVFLHGGAFIIGSSNDYIGDVLSVKGDVIVVTLNFRLAVLGFLSTGNENSPGNYGLWDQHMAFQWIHENIEAFKGNPRSVTIFGESAGSACVIHHALYPGNRELFHRVIAEGGSPIATHSTSNFFGKPNGHLVAEATDCTFEDLVSCLREKTVEEIYLALNNANISFVPVVDNDFINFKPNVVLSSNETRSSEIRDMFASLDLIIGINSMESALQMIYYWAPLLKIDPNNLELPKMVFTEQMIPKALSIIYETKSLYIPNVLKDAVKFQYVDWKDPENATTQRDMALRFTADFSFFVPSVKTANFHATLSKRKKTYFYLLSARMSLHDYLQTPAWLTGADHGDDVYFVFGFSKRMIKESQFIPTPEETRASNCMLTMWTNFAKSGNPNRPVTFEDIPEWPTYDPVKKKYMDFSLQMSDRSSSSYFGEPFTSFWLDVMPSIYSSLPFFTEVTSTTVPTTEMTSGPISHVFHINSVTSDNIIISLIVVSMCLLILSLLLCTYSLGTYGAQKNVRGDT